MKISLHILRGGSGGAPAQQATNTTSTQQPWAPAQPYLNSIMNQGAKLYASGPQQYTPWSQAATLDPMQQSAMKGITDYSTSGATRNWMGNATNQVNNLVSGAPNQTQQVANQGMGNVVGMITNNNLMDPSQAANQMAYGDNINPYVQSQVDAEMQKLTNNFSMNTLPGLRRNAIGNGTYGSSRNEMTEGLAAGQLSNDMFETASRMYGNAYNTANQNSLNALGQSAQQMLNQAGLTNGLFAKGNEQNLNAQSIGLQNYINSLNMPLHMLEQQGQVGLQQFQQNQAQLNDATNRWNFNQAEPWNNFGRYKSLIDNNAQYGGSQSGQSSSVTPNPPSSTAANVTGGLLTAAALASQFGGK